MTSADSGDGAAIYDYDYPSHGATRGVRFAYNYVRDFGSPSAQATTGGLTHGIYLDDDLSFVTVTGNVVAGLGTDCFFYHGGQGNDVSGNICDLGPAADGAQLIAHYQFSTSCPDAGCASGNYLQNNIVTSSASLTQGGNFTYLTGQTPLDDRNELDHGYGVGTVTDPGSVSSVDPEFVPGSSSEASRWAYVLTSGSPAYSSPVAFPSQPSGWGAPGFWGPPGFVVPRTGTPPSNP